jgi:hypothetical protein
VDRFEPIGPRHCVGGAVNIVFVAVTAGGYMPQNAAGDAAFEIDPVAEEEIAPELDAAADGMNIFSFELA